MVIRPCAFDTLRMAQLLSPNGSRGVLWSQNAKGRLIFVNRPFLFCCALRHSATFRNPSGLARGPQNAKGRLIFINRPFLFWCPRRDSNPHTSRHMDLNHARLPIPPRGLRCKAKTVIIDGLKALSTTFSLPWHHFRCNTMLHPCFTPVLRLGKWPQLRYTRHIRPPGRASPWHL